VDLARNLARRLTPEETVARVELELPVVPGAREHAVAHESHGERMPFVRTGVLERVHASLAAHAREPAFALFDERGFALG
jgi:hypothetical protein